nr:hypothetical protein [uncultured Brevundimonas sp.]
MLLVFGILLLGVSGYLIREAMKAEFILSRFKASGRYEEVEAFQLKNFLRRVLIAICCAVSFVAIYAALAPQSAQEFYGLVRLAANRFQS